MLLTTNGLNLEYLYAEMFIDVPEIYSVLVNAHLQLHLHKFDELYQTHGGTLGSLSHVFERYQVGLNLCEHVKNVMGNDPKLHTLTSQTEYDSSSLNASICFETTTRYVDWEGQSILLPIQSPN